MTYVLLFLVALLALLLSIAARFIMRTVGAPAPELCDLAASLELNLRGPINRVDRERLEAIRRTLYWCLVRVDAAMGRLPMPEPPEKLSATKLAARHNTSAAVIQEQLARLGYIENRHGVHYFTDLGLRVGGDYHKNHSEASDADGHMVWPVDIPLANVH